MRNIIIPGKKRVCFSDALAVMRRSSHDFNNQSDLTTSEKKREFAEEEAGYFYADMYFDLSVDNRRSPNKNRQNYDYFGKDFMARKYNDEIED